MTENKGALDNYLSAEEEAYFKSHGAESAEEKVEESLSEEREPVDGDVSAESEHDDTAVAESAEPTDDAGDSDDEPDTLTTDEPVTKAQRDYEKAFKAERHKRKELKEALEANTRKTAELEQSLQQIQQSMRTPAPQAAPVIAPEPAPDPSEDPLGYQQYQIQQLEKQITEQNKYLHQRHENEQQSAKKQAFFNMYRASAQEFAQKAPDFQEAYKHLVSAKVEEYMAAGYNQEQADQLLIEDEMGIVAKAYQDKVNPAERIYNLAKKRGYAGKTVAAKPAGKSLSDIKKGMENSKSLKSGGGEIEDKNHGIDDVDGMSFDEFDKFWAGYKSKAKGVK